MPNDTPIMKNSSNKISATVLTTLAVKWQRLKSSDIFEMSDDTIWYAIYAAISLWAFFYYYHVITQPDTFNYLIISEDFLHGRIREGINSMWGSLITILIVPFLAVGLSGLTAFKIVQIIIGFFTLHVFLKFLNRFRFSFLWKIFIVVPVLPLLVLAALILTPDLLLLTAVMWYIFLVSEFADFHGRDAINRVSTVKIGIAGGLMYWSKSYGFPFFVAHFTALNLLIVCLFFLNKYLNRNVGAVHPLAPSKGGDERNVPFKEGDTSASSFSRSEKSPPLEGAGGWTAFNFNLKKQITSYIIATLIFTLISSVWIAAISLKTGQVTIGTAGKYNIALKGNVMNDTHLTKNELIDPNTPYTKYWIYHEAGLFTEAWNPFESPENRRHFFDNFKHNLSSLYYVSFVRDLLILIGLCGFVWLVGLFTQSTPQPPPKGETKGVSPPKGETKGVSPPKGETKGVSPPKGETKTVSSPKEEIHTRKPPHLEGVSPSSPPLEEAGGWKTGQIYFTLVALLACVIYAGGYLLVFIQQRYLWLVFMMLWLVFLLMIKNYPVKKIAFVWLVLASLIMTINHVDRLREMTKDRPFFAHLSEVSEVLRPSNLKGKSVAANHVKGNMISVDADIYLMYEHRFDYWGQLSNKKIENEGLAELYDKKTDYFFCWDSPDFESELFKKHQLIFRDDTINLSVYKLL